MFAAVSKDRGSSFKLNPQENKLTNFDIDISKSKGSTRIIRHDNLGTCAVVSLHVDSHANNSPYRHSRVTGFLAPSEFAEFL